LTVLPKLAHRRPLALVVGLTALAAALRLWQIGDQSYWLDESFSAAIVGRPFGQMLESIPRTESTPPLYYLLGWAWTQLFGNGEAGLRSLSALFGVAAVPVSYMAARELWNERAGVFAAALVAVNPYFVWYGQEARSYGLMILLASLSVWLWARVLAQPSGRRVAAWALAAALMLATHYFAVFLLVPEAAWLLWRLRSRAAVLGVGAVGAAGLALVPLLLRQSEGAKTAFISAESGLAGRVTDMAKKFVTGELGTPRPLIGAVALAAVLTGVVLLFVRGSERDRRSGVLVLGLAAATVAIPLVFALAGADYLLPRNLIAAYLPFVLLVGAGFAAGGRIGVALAAIVCAVALVVTVDVTRDPQLQRDDWRGAARALGPATAPRAVIVTSEPQKHALELYAGTMRPLPPGGVPVKEIVVIGNARPPRFADPPVPPGFRPVERRRTDSWELIRYVAGSPTPVTPDSLLGYRLGPKLPAIRLQEPAGA
jgi:uncharacterized membrane protein